MIAIIMIVVAMAATVGLTVLVLVAAAVRREERGARLSVEAPGSATATARRVVGLHVRRTSLSASAGQNVKPAWRSPRLP